MTIQNVDARDEIKASFDSSKKGMNELGLLPASRARSVHRRMRVVGLGHLLESWKTVNPGVEGGETHGSEEGEDEEEAKGDVG